MRTTVILACVALPLLAVGVLVLIVATTESAPMVDHQVKPSDSIPRQTSVPAMATPRPAAPSHFASTALVPSPSPAPAAPGQAAPGRNKRSVRAAVLAAKLQQLPKAGQSPASAANPARESMPPAEVAAMAAKGMDWRKIEEMLLRGGVPSEPAAPRAEEPPAPSEGHNEETR